jgi:hypothetical protein
LYVASGQHSRGNLRYLQWDRLTKINRWPILHPLQLNPPCGFIHRPRWAASPLPGDFLCARRVITGLRVRSAAYPLVVGVVSPTGDSAPRQLTRGRLRVERAVRGSTGSCSARLTQKESGPIRGAAGRNVTRLTNVGTPLLVPDRNRNATFAVIRRACAGCTPGATRS